MLIVFFTLTCLFDDWMKYFMVLNIRNVVKNVMYSIVHSTGIISRTKGYLFYYFSLTF